MTITNYFPLFFLCFITPLILSHVQAYVDEDTNSSITVSVKAAEPAHSTCSCRKRDISISQSRETTSGIPQYVVEIVNMCVSSESAPYDIHLHCGWFASARIVNPRLFKRLSYDDCLVNGGKPLASSQIIRFTYSNSFMYSLVFKSAKFCLKGLLY